MKHLSEGELRCMLDDPESLSAQARLHARTCEQCRSAAAAIAQAAQQARQALEGNVAVDAARVYPHVRDRIGAPRPPVRRFGALGAAGLAAALLLGLIFTPLGGYARSFLTIFEPRQFEPIAVSPGDLRDLHLLPQAGDVGMQRTVRKPVRTYYASIGAAQAHAGFTVLHPTTLPAHFGVVRSFSTIAPGEMTFTFSAAKARAFEQRSHKTLPPMPPALDGTTVRVQTGHVFTGHYEASSAHASHAAGKRNPGTEFFELVEAQVPRVTSTGASLDSLEQYLLAMPNVSPQLAAQLRALGDIQNIVPVPVVIDKQTSQRVSVNGVQGLQVGDNTGLGAGVMWEKNGMIYVVAGPLTMNEVMSVADGLR